MLCRKHFSLTYTMLHGTKPCYCTEIHVKISNLFSLWHKLIQKTNWAVDDINDNIQVVVDTCTGKYGLVNSKLLFINIQAWFNVNSWCKHKHIIVSFGKYVVEYNHKFNIEYYGLSVHCCYYLVNAAASFIQIICAYII